jgi:hypothetical protein
VIAHSRAPLYRATVLAAAAAVAVACGAPAEAPTPEVPHGYVAGAEEAAEAQSRLVVADEAGAVRVLDLVTEEVVEAGSAGGVTSVAGDGRHAYLAAADGTVRIVDSGAWTVDHGDHSHYYRAAVREVGSVPGADPVAVHADQAVAALALADGTVALLDRARLDEGAVVELATIPRTPHRGPAVPYEGHVLASVVEPGQQLGSGVAVHDRAGTPVATIDEPCPELEGAAVTRRGVVFGCADGALLVSGSDGAFRGEKIPYPQAVTADERAREFRHRRGSALLTARAGEAGIWALDVTERTWSRHGAGPVAAVNSAGEGTALLTLTADGVLHALDPASGQELAATPLLTAPVAPGVRIEVDTSRAYVNDPAAGVIHEIDYADALRVARTFDLGGTPSRMVETGR